MNRDKWTKATALLAVVAFLIALPTFVRHPYILHIIIMSGIGVILSTSLRLTMIPGLWNLAQIAFFAIGSYTVYLLMSNFGLCYWFSLILGATVAGVIALGFGYATMRAKGIYFCLMTIAFVELIRLTIVETPFLGGWRMVEVPRISPISLPYLFTINFSSKVSYYYLMLVLVALTIVVLNKIEKSRVGILAEAIAQSEPLAQSLGINTVGYGVLMFCIGSFFAGIAGGLYASYIIVLGTGTFTVWASLMVFMQVIVGGVESIYGAIIGAILLTVLPEFFRIGVQYEQLLSAVVVIVVVFFLPGGLISLPRVAKVKWIARKGDKSATRVR